MEKITPLLKTFLFMSKTSINDEGIYPHHLIYMVNDKMSVASLMLKPEEVYAAVAKVMRTEKPSQLIVGLDRVNKDGQGVDMKYHSVLTIAYYALGMWSVGAMPYASKDDVGEVVWSNAWWNTHVRKELKAFSPIASDPSDEVIGSAYHDRIAITAVRRTDMGDMYEGFIRHDKLEDTTKEFLAEHSLDINDRPAVIEKIKSLGGDLEFIDEGMGFWTAKISTKHDGSGIFPARKSRTKVYLEAVEAIADKLSLIKT
jgi:hypothetical protein